MITDDIFTHINKNLETQILNTNKIFYAETTEEKIELIVLKINEIIKLLSKERT